MLSRASSGHAGRPHAVAQIADFRSDADPVDGVDVRISGVDLLCTER